MKHLILLLFLTLSVPAIFGQNINYTVVKDEPIEPRISVNMDFFNLDINTDISNLRTDNVTMNIGLFGYAKLIKTLEIDYTLHKSWLTFGKLGFKDYPGNTEINAGVKFWLSNRTVQRNTKVVLKQTETQTANETTTTTTYVVIPAQHIKRFGVRGGVYSKSGPFNFDDYTGGENSTGINETKFSSYGIYAGFNFRNISNIIIKDNIYGRSMNSVGRDIYFEALFIPVNRFKDLNANNVLVSETVKDFKSTSPLGFRIGYRSYQVEKKAFTGKKFGICGIGEFGYKPYQGWFITGGFGLTLVKH